MSAPPKMVPQLDLDGFLVDIAFAFENPVRPGTFLIPGGALDAPIPDVPSGQRARWTGADWELSDIPAPSGQPGAEPVDN